MADQGFSRRAREVDYENIWGFKGWRWWLKKMGRG